METKRTKVDNPFATEEIPVPADGLEDEQLNEAPVIARDPQVAAAAQAIALATGMTRAEATAMILERQSKAKK